MLPHSRGSMLYIATVYGSVLAGAPTKEGWKLWWMVSAIAKVLDSFPYIERRSKMYDLRTRCVSSIDESVMTSALEELAG
ncbi:hypothetical protein F4604DRAFT_1712964 [Suillus subluteus]|nr:hypothetical protein F4604DRAFT_1712964 [Suillus subluteus]